MSHPSQGPTLAAPRAMQPYPRLTSPQPTDSLASPSAGRSPSPSKRSFNFPMGDPSERWNSIGQATQGPSASQSSGALRSGMPRKQSIHSSAGPASSVSPNAASLAAAAAEPFLGYNELFSPNGTHLSASDSSKGAGGGNVASLSTSDPMSAAFPSSSGPETRGFSLPSHQEQDAFAARFGPPPSGPFASGRDETGYGPSHGAAPSSSTAAVSRSAGLDDFGGRQPFGGNGGQIVPSMTPAGNLSPRSLMHYHHQQMQAQQAMAMQAQHQQGNQSGAGNAANLGGPGGPAEEITTVFIVGFPDDMTEREFANMFLFARGFEASTLKIPAGLTHAGPGGRGSDGGGPLSSGPGGPYHAVNMPGSGLFDLPGSAAAGSWEDQNLSMALSRAGVSDAFSSLANMGNLPGALGGGGVNSANAQSLAASAAAGGKIKQIIGFAKFRTRAEALEARDALNGRKIDAEKGCVLKTEMAKKNLHTKQRPVLSAGGIPEGSLGFGPPTSLGGPVGPGGPLSPTGGPGGIHGASAAPHGASFGPGGPFDPRAGHPATGQGGPHPGMVGAFGALPLGKSPAGFEVFAGQSRAGGGGNATPGDLLSPQEMFGGGSDFFSQTGGPPGLRPMGGGSLDATSYCRTSQPPQSGSDKWGAPSMGPLDYYGPESSGSSSGAIPAAVASGRSNLMSTNAMAGRPDWTIVGSPPPGLYSLNALPGSTSQASTGIVRPEFQRQGSRAGPLSGATSDNGKNEDVGRTGESAASARSGSSPTSTSAETHDQQHAQQQQQPFASRFGNLKLSSPTSEDGTCPGPSVAGRSSNQIPSPDLPSPTSRNIVVGDNHPPGNTLFVGNLPSNASSGVLSQVEDHLRALFGGCRGFRQFSFRLKSNGPMCFVEFEDVHTASRAMADLNGNSLNGAIKNGGIRLSFSKNPLFRMNSISGMSAAAGSFGSGPSLAAGGQQAGTTGNASATTGSNESSSSLGATGAGAVPTAGHMSLGLAGESIGGGSGGGGGAATVQTRR
ncbi:hypothetical protein BCV70DRAFT_202572 [Testicularia cyperi]|uniref:RRM domain-containing protein n=1 Tax=Testicularia cyperi TaxID=1882483 RepID=A0A317XIC2_9BASI|nr:hypothetical protein BCV70DRAFT_202572 [Testicularia cyperi]